MRSYKTQRIKENTGKKETTQRETRRDMTKKKTKKRREMQAQTKNGEIQGERMMMTMPQHAQHFLRSDGKSCSAKARRRVLLCYKILLVNLGAFKLPASRRWPVLDMFVLPFHPARLSCRMPLFLTPDRLLHLVFTHIVFDW